MQIVTGRRGEPHVTSRQMQAVYRSFLGDFALLDIGEKLRAEAYSNDIVRVYDGVVSVQGIYAVIAYNQYDEVYIEPVSVGKKRIDTIVLHYTKNNTLDVEDMQLDVVQGEEYTDNPIAPVVPEGGDAWEGTTDIQVPIYDVEVTNFGLTVTPYSRMLTVIPTLESIAERIPETVVTGVKGDSEVLYRDGNVNITKANIGLGNVDNTADTDKPISTATQTALNLKADLTYVDAKISAAYHAGGSKTVAELTSALLIADNMGKVYNMSDSGVTTSDFVEGAGKPIHEGDNVGICNVGTEESPVYKFDLLSGFVDLSAYATTSAVNTALADKVDKVAGKGLSTNDFTDTLKDKLDGIEAGAQVNTVDSVNGKTGVVTLDKSDVGLGNVDNTSDLTKPISNAVKVKLIETAESMKSLWDLSDYEGEPVNCSIGLPSESYVPSQEYWGQKFLNVEDGGMWDVVRMHPSEEYAFIKNDQVNLISANYNKTPVLGIHINDSEENPDRKVTYIADAVGMTPAHMDYTNNVFDYGSFANMWFVKDCKPCIFHHSGYVMKYLNPSDFTKDIDGNTVAIDGGLTDAEIMIEHPKTWIKFSPDPTNDASADVFFSPVKIDADFKDFPYINYQGVHKEKFYMPAYMGSLIDGHMRSLSGQQVKNRLTATDERAYCKANGNGWDLVQSSMFMHIDMLLLLMGRTTDIKKAFGQGLHTGGTEAINNNFRTGVHNDKGMFYGTNSGTIADGSYGNTVKIFGTENYYGFAWIRKLGDMLIDGVRRIKMCYGNEDGSSTYDYNLTGDGYVNVGATPSGTSGGFISKMKFTILGMFAKVASGTETTHYKAGYWFNTSGTRMALHGGSSVVGSRVSPFCLYLFNGPAYADWDFASAPSYI